ncbi:hypothetical protein AN216_22835 [Streptomyces oceani]|uniref:Uncharacterized protein n=1 Tax=Streptomyces oceani TaxID=1075402 RepID=A0A1E7JWH5_9ACTN|nr:hypothetical protein AN216_22835 [Streptomyces oceani]
MLSPSGPSDPLAPAEPAPAAARRATLALARTEAWRLARHPLVLLALLGTVVTLFLPGEGPDAYPVLHYADQDAQLGALLVGLAGMIATNSATLRAHRHGTDRQFDVLVLAPHRRTLARVLAALPLALAVALLTLAAYLRDALRPGAVGQGSVAELLTGPVVVLCLCALGVLLGRLSRSALLAPLVTLLLITVTFVFVGAPEGSAWLAPTVPSLAPEPQPAALLGRPAGWHVVYLLAIAVLCTAAAGWFSGSRGRLVRSVLIGALVVAGTAGALQTRGPSAELTADRERATNDPAAVQDCVRHGRTTYCAYDDYLPRADEWHAVTEAVRTLVGPPAREAPRTVRQRVDAVGAPEGISMKPADDAGTVGTAWGETDTELEFAASFSRSLVLDDDPPAAGRYCDSRNVLIGWLATAATDTTDVLPGLQEQTERMLRELLRQPTDEVTQRVRQHLTELTRPGVSAERTAELLGVSPPAHAGTTSSSAC